MASVKITHGGQAVMAAPDAPGKTVCMRSLRYLLYAQVELEDGVCFGDVWRLIAQDAEFYERVFSESLGRRMIEPFLAEARLPPDDDSGGPLAAGAYVVRWEGAEICDEEEDLNSVSLRAGMYALPRRSEMPEEAGARWEAGKVGINNLMRVRLEQDNLFRIRRWRLPKNRKKKQGGLYEGEVGVLAALATPMRVLDLFEAVLATVARYGTPAERARRMSEADQQAARKRDKK